MHRLIADFVVLLAGVALGYGFRGRESKLLIDIHQSLLNLKNAIDARAASVKADVKKDL